MAAAFIVLRAGILMRSLNERWRRLGRCAARGGKTAVFLQDSTPSHTRTHASFCIPFESKIRTTQPLLFFPDFLACFASFVQLLVILFFLLLVFFPCV